MSTKKTRLNTRTAVWGWGVQIRIEWCGDGKNAHAVARWVVSGPYRAWVVMAKMPVRSPDGWCLVRIGRVWWFEGTLSHKVRRFRILWSSSSRHRRSDLSLPHGRRLRSFILVGGFLIVLARKCFGENIVFGVGVG